VWYNTCVKYEFVKGGKKMSKRCAICDKTKLFGNKVTFSHRKSSRSWGANIRKVRVVVDGSGIERFYVQCPERGKERRK